MGPLLVLSDVMRRSCQAEPSTRDRVNAFQFVSSGRSKKEAEVKKKRNKKKTADLTSASLLTDVNPPIINYISPKKKLRGGRNEKKGKRKMANRLTGSCLKLSMAVATFLIS